MTEIIETYKKTHNKTLNIKMSKNYPLLKQHKCDETITIKDESYVLFGGIHLIYFNIQQIKFKQWP